MFTCAFAVPQTECETGGLSLHQRIWNHPELDHASLPACEPWRQSRRNPQTHTSRHVFHNPRRSDIRGRTVALLHRL